MAIGYLNDDGTIDPVLGKRIKTGDLGIKDNEGFVRVTGRSKDLIIRGGINIAPLEIDEVLLKHAGIVEAAAVGVPDKIYGEEVIGYVMPSTRRSTEADVMDAQRQNPAAGQAPKQVIIVPDFPRAIAARCCATSCAKNGRRGIRPRPDPRLEPDEFKSNRYAGSILVIASGAKQSRPKTGWIASALRASQ